MSYTATGSPKGTLLIVDDTQTNRDLLSEILVAKGYHVLTASDGHQALAATASTPPDLILLDIKMPGMDGYQVCQELKQKGPTQDIPIIFMSVLEDTADKVRALNVGGADYITKPFEFPEVLARIETHLALRNARRQLQEANDELERRFRELKESNRHLQEEIAERARVESQRDAMLKTLQERTAQLEALREVGLQLSAQLDLESVLRSVVSRAVELLGGAGGSLNLYRPERDCLEVVTTEGQAILPPGSTFQRNQGLSGKVWDSGQVLAVDDYQHWGGQNNAGRPVPITAAIGVPIRWGERFLGTLVVVDTARRTFSQSDTDLLGLFATQAAIAIENARLYDQAQRDAEMKETLLHEVNHRVGNSLSVLIGLLEIEQSYLELGDERRCQEALKGMANRLQGLAGVHRTLSSAGWTPLRLDELSRQLVETTLKLLPMDKYVSLEITPSDVRVSPKQAHNLGMVINELATNAVKYAWQDRDRGCIKVDIRLEEESGTVCFEFRDDGPGYPEEALRMERHTVGFDLIQDMANYALGGEISLYNEGGAVALIRFKPSPDET
jgi:DNA-binding response OmpR family regulator/two-component sensor histidine kinase